MNHKKNDDDERRGSSVCICVNKSKKNVDEIVSKSLKNTSRAAGEK